MQKSQPPLSNHLLKDGVGIPIVFLHGFLGTSSDWLPLVSHFPNPCIGIDLPGHGASPFTENFEIDLPYFHLVGYSMGGRLALTVPKEKICTLHLISTHPGLKTKEERELRLQHDQKIAQDLLDLPIDLFLKTWYAQPLFCGLKPNFEQRKKQDVQNLSKALLHYSLGHQSYYELDQVIVGALDTKFRSLFQNPIVVEGASHAVHLEKPEIVAQHIQRRMNR